MSEKNINMDMLKVINTSQAKAILIKSLEHDTEIFLLSGKSGNKVLLDQEVRALLLDHFNNKAKELKE